MVLWQSGEAEVTLKLTSITKEVRFKMWRVYELVAIVQIKMHVRVTRSKCTSYFYNYNCHFHNTKFSN